MTKKQVGEERVYLASSSILLFIIKGQDRNSNRAGAWRQELMHKSQEGTAYWCASPGLLSLLSYRTQDLDPRDDTTHDGLGPASSITNFKQCLTAGLSGGISSSYPFRRLWLVCQADIRLTSTMSSLWVCDTVSLTGFRTGIRTSYPMATQLG